MPFWFGAVAWTAQSRAFTTFIGPTLEIHDVGMIGKQESSLKILRGRKHDSPILWKLPVAMSPRIRRLKMDAQCLGTPV